MVMYVMETDQQGNGIGNAEGSILTDVVREGGEGGRHTDTRGKIIPDRETTGQRCLMCLKMRKEAPW